MISVSLSFANIHPILILIIIYQHWTVLLTFFWVFGDKFYYRISARRENQSINQKIIAINLCKKLSETATIFPGTELFYKLVSM